MQVKFTEETAYYCRFFLLMDAAGSGDSLFIAEVRFLCRPAVGRTLLALANKE